MLSRIKKYYRFAKFLRRAHADYNHYTSSLAAHKKDVFNTDAIPIPTIDSVLKAIDGDKIGIVHRSDFTISLVIKNYDAPYVFGKLATLLPNATFEIDGEMIESDKVTKTALSLGSQKLRCVYQGDPASFEVLIETYFRQSHTGKWQCATKKNFHAKVISESFWSNDDQLKKKIASSSENLKQRVGEVDVVYTWANVYDKQWMQQRSTNTAEARQKGAESTSETRINDNNELRYSIRSVKKHMPWVRNIYIVSTGSPPNWLNLSYDSSIQWIMHGEIIDAYYLPTFNSHVIESCLHKISGLSNFFVYLNDDIMITSPMERSYFFDINGQPVSKMEAYGMVNAQPDEDDPDYLNASRNSADLLYNDYRYYPTQLHEHCPQILGKDILQEIEDKYSKPIDALRKNKFRDMQDINITSFFYHHYAYITKRGLYDCRADNKLISSSSPTWREDMAAFLNSSMTYQSLCLNEGGEQSSGWSTAVPAFLDKLFSQKGSWEK